MATSIKNFLTDEEMASIENGGSPDFISDEEMNKIESPAIETPKNPAWYDVPGKFSKTGEKTISKIRKEGEVTAAGGNPLVGGAASLLHLASNPVEQLGNVLSPIIENPLSKGIGSSVDKFGRVMGIGERRGKEGEPNLLRDLYKKATGYLDKKPEIKNRIESGLNVGGMFVGAPAAKGAEEAAMQTLKKTIPDALEGFATRGQNRIVKINSPEWNMGARPELNAKYGVIGKKAEDAVGHWGAIENIIYDGLDKKITGQLDNPDNIVSTSDIKNHAINVVKNSKGSDLQKIKQINEIEKYFDDPDFANAYPNEQLNILQAQKLKIDTGRNGAWYTKGFGAKSDPNAPIKAQAANAIYDALKVNVENKGSPGIKELNKALSEIIPMRLAAEKRMMVDKRTNFTSLDDVVAITGALAAASHGNVAGMLFAGGNMAVKSPLTARASYGLSQNLRGEKVPAGIKEIQRALSLPEKDVTKNYGTPAYFRKGINPEVRSTPIITDERRMLPAPMIETNNPKQILENMLPTYGDRIRSIGKFESPPLKPEMSLRSSKGDVYPKIPDDYFSDDPFNASLVNKKELKEIRRLDDANIKLRNASGDYPNMENYNPDELMTLDDLQSFKYAKEIEQHQKDLAKQAKKEALSSYREVSKGKGTDRDLMRNIADNEVQMKIVAEQLGYNWPLTAEDYPQFLAEVRRLIQEQR